MERWILLVAGIYMVSMAVIDIRKKEIPVVPGIVCAIIIIGIQLLGGNKWTNWLPGVTVGIVLWIVSKASHGAIGEGDAIAYAISGLALGFWGNLEVLVISLVLASLVGVCLMIFCRVGRKHSMAFIPFTAVAYGMVVCL